MRAFILFLSLLYLGGPAWAAETELVDTGYVHAQLISSHDTVAPGQTFYMALRTDLDEGWHTYWQNPGDSGEQVQISWTTPDILTYGEIIWPLPSPVATGPIINYGFEGSPIFPVEFKVSETAIPGEAITVEGDVYYLVCKDICVPESAKLSLWLTVGEPVVDELSNSNIQDAISSAPKRGEILAGVVKDGSYTVFSFSDLPPNADLSSAYFFPIEQGVIDHSAPQQAINAEKGLQIRTRAGFAWDEGQPDSAMGVLRFKSDGKPIGQYVDVEVGTSAAIGAVPSAQTPPKKVASLGLWTAIWGALLGGLILNLMPCVFPVISLKALSVTKQAHTSAGQIRREGWIYTAGVVATFLVLTGALLIFKAAGNEIGWGFQLQSPKVVAGLAILLFVIGLNLVGVFEFGGKLQGVGSGFAQKQGWLGTFSTGALAVIVATPCTAPFMAGAIGYALAQSAMVTFAVFMALAIGFAAPFLILSYFPALLKSLPKPGPWMQRFREFLSFPMFAATIWLLWVLTQQAGEKGLLGALAAMLLIAFAIWLARSTRMLSRLVAAIVLISAMALPFTLHPKAVELTYPNMEPWSSEKVADLRGEGRAVFVDFTAAWCVTCKLNKKMVLDKPDVQAIFKSTDTAFLVADWTNKNDIIAAELARHGRSGVPLYLLFPAGHDDVSPVILPQILTKNIVEDAIQSVQ